MTMDRPHLGNSWYGGPPRKRRVLGPHSEQRSGMSITPEETGTSLGEKRGNLRESWVGQWRKTLLLGGILFGKGGDSGLLGVGVWKRKKSYGTASR